MTRSEDPHNDSKPTGDELLSETPVARPVRWARRLGIGLLSAVTLVVLVAVLLYNFGTMESPTAEQRAQYADLEKMGAVPPAPKAAFAIPIPGCKCHSDDPILAVQHSTRPIRQCKSCHGPGGEASR